MRSFIALLLVVGSGSVLSDEPAARPVFSNVDFPEAVGWKADTAPDARFVYGDGRAPQHVDLRLPASDPPPEGFPVIVFIHGGAWRAEWSKNYSEAFVEALSREGFATWDLEFRRLGHRDGGYPGTFEDVADGADHLRTIADAHPLDLGRVVAVGHSSGGHLALWLAGRGRLPESSALHRADPLPLRGVISIAGVNDLELSYTLGGREDVLTLIGVDTPQAGAGRFAETNPGRLLPLGVPQSLMIGDGDSPWRLEMTRRYADNALAAGDPARVVIVPGANHMDVTDAGSGFARDVAREARRMFE